MIRLCTSEGCIQIDTSDKQWCHCTLVREGIQHRLGAETFVYITRQLLHVLSNPWQDPDVPADGEIDGAKVIYALGLSEEHSTLYISADSHSRTLFWQDKDGNLICTMHLSSEQLLQWRKQLQLAWRLRNERVH